jgi:hypothetical protein
MEIPAFKQLNPKMPFAVEAPNGTIQFVPLSARRGNGRKLYCLSIQGISNQPIATATQYYVHFNGG